MFARGQTATIVALLGLLGCSGVHVEDFESIGSVTEEPPGDSCEFGGDKIEFGVDENGDGALQAFEVDETTYLCDDEVIVFEGLVTESAEAEGSNCTYGGTRVDYGVDDNQDDVLQQDEVDGTTYYCDEPGGFTSILTSAAELPGANCTYGGTKAEYGIDDNEDSTLQPAEVDATTYFCDNPEGWTSIAVLTAEDPGSNCTYGGTKIEHGVDDNEDSALQPGEIRDTTYYCLNPGGWTTIVVMSPELPGATCAYGGTKVETGIDDNEDSTLQQEEIDHTEYTCDRSCGNGVVDPGDEVDFPISPFTSLTVDTYDCRWDFSSVRQLYCEGSWSWGGPSGCDQADADIFCVLLTDNRASTATSFTTPKALDIGGFTGNSTGTGTVLYTDRDIVPKVRYSEAGLLTDGIHGGGKVILDPVCTNP